MVEVQEAPDYAEILERLKRQVLERVRTGATPSEGQEAEENLRAQTKAGEST